MKKNIKMDDLISLCRRRGFIFQSSEIYGGLQGVYDFGPLGVELKNNLKNAWWKAMVYERDDIEGIDCGILTHQLTLRHSGHEETFTDPLCECKNCGNRMRADHVKNGQCDKCGSKDLTEPRSFNLMFKTFIGVTEDAKGTVYLRPETCAGIFTNFKNVLRSTRGKLPLGIGQIGKAFRNEITPGNFIFRTREFEQMELEFFCNPSEGMNWFKKYRTACMEFAKYLGLSDENLRFRDHSPEELVFYSAGTTDIEYKYPFGWSELWGIAYRTDYDLSRNSEFSG